MSRNWLLAGLASALIAAAVVVFAIDVDDEPPRPATDTPEQSPEERVGRMMQTFLSRVVELELRPRVTGLDGTQVIDGSAGTATVRRVVEDDRTEIRIMFDGYVLRLDPRVTLENEIQADGTVSYVLAEGQLRVTGTGVRLGVFDVEQRRPRIDMAGRFTFDLAGRDVAGLTGEVVRNGDQRLEIKAATPSA